jgi:hypothetical protein
MGTVLIRWLGKLLLAREREAVLGDIAELRMSNLEAAREICGLLARRAFRYLVLIIFVVASADVALRFGLSLWRGYALYAWIVGNYEFIDRRTLEATGLTLERGIPILMLQSLLMCAWTWISFAGFVRFARRGGFMPIQYAIALAGMSLALGVVTGFGRAEMLLGALYIAATALTTVRKKA